MILHRIPVYLALFCSGLLWSAAAQGPADSKLGAGAEEDIKEAVLRKRMMEWVASGDRSEKEAKTKTDREIASFLNFPTFFVEVEKKDPGEAFLKRLPMFREL
jgi:hypothetical protein